MAHESQGTVLYLSSDGTTVASTADANAIGSVVGFNGPTGSANIIDITNLGSTAKEKMVGLPDEGQFSFDMTLDTGNAVQTRLRAARAARTKKKVVIKLNDSTDDKTKTKILFDGYVTGFSITGAVDDFIKANAQIEITGPCTWTNSTVVPLP